MSANVSTFSSEKQGLHELLSDIRSGKLQLPDFQRNWVWDDEHIRSLLASISLSYPIGAVLFLETSGERAKFLPRMVQGAPTADVPPERLILDGQQRLTALYRALYMREPVATKDARGNTVKRWYYMDIQTSLDPTADREDAVRSLPEDKVVRTNFNRDVVLDCSTRELECENGLFPLSIVFDTSARNAWRRSYQRPPDESVRDERLDIWDEFEDKVLNAFIGYQVPIIQLKKTTPAEAVARVFEKVNTGGVSLTVFELVTAMFSSQGFRLREDWKERQQRLATNEATRPLLKKLEASDFLTGVTLLASYRRYEESQDSSEATVVKCKRKDVLELSLEDYKRVAEDLTDGFVKAAKFLVQHKIFQRRDLPYTTQVIPLAAILTALGEQAEHDGARQKLARWYWCGVFGELYSSSVETRFAKDLPEVVAWIREHEPEPTTITDSNFAADRLLRLRTRNSAAYKEVSALLMRRGGLDFRSGEPIEVQTFFDEALDIHHIFPRAWCDKNSIEPERYNSIINKTPLSSRTNRIIGGQAPSLYLPRLEKEAGLTSERLNHILDTHLISAHELRTDDFSGFFEARRDALLTLIESATGKPVMRDEIKPVDDTGLASDERSKSGIPSLVDSLRTTGND